MPVIWDTFLTDAKENLQKKFDDLPLEKILELFWYYDHKGQEYHNRINQLKELDGG